MIFEVLCKDIKQAVSKVRNLHTASELAKKENAKMELQSRDEGVFIVSEGEAFRFAIEIRDAELHAEGAVRIDINELWDVLKPFTKTDETLLVELEDDTNIGIQDTVNGKELLVVEEGSVLDSPSELPERKEGEKIPKKTLTEHLNMARKLNRSTFHEATNHVGLFFDKNTVTIRSFNFTTMFEGKVKLEDDGQSKCITLDKQNTARFTRLMEASRTGELRLEGSENVLYLTDDTMTVVMISPRNEEVEKTLLSLPFGKIDVPVLLEAVPHKEWVDPLRAQRKEKPERIGLSTKNGLTTTFSKDVIPQAFNYKFKPILDISTQTSADFSIGVGTKENKFPLLMQSTNDNQTFSIVMMGYEENIADGKATEKKAV